MKAQSCGLKEKSLDLEEKSFNVNVGTVGALFATNRADLFHAPSSVC